jgi:hypothetical protein
VKRIVIARANATTGPRQAAAFKSP